MDSMNQALISALIKTGGVEIRDVDGGEEPFLYSSGNKGPGYIDVKGRCSIPGWVEACAAVLAQKVVNMNAVPDFVTGNATGGMIASWEFGRQLSQLVGCNIPYFYIRGTRKVGGHQELVTGQKSLFAPGKVATVGEELINYASTTSQAAEYLRNRHQLTVNVGTSFLNYDHPENRAALEAAKLTSAYLFTLSDVLHHGVREGLLQAGPVEKFKVFLKDPAAWMAERGLERVVPDEK